ncbi:hypothetical protein ACK35Y_15010 [Aeromonas veronii]
MKNMVSDSKRKANFKKVLIKKIPFFPDDKSTLLEIESHSLCDVMFYYLHWSTRQIPSRPRKVHLYPEVTSDKRYKKLKEQIKSLREKISNGEDLSPYLSLRAHKKGYTPKQRIIDGKVDSWEDKDQLLNTTGFHHFHLDMTVQHTGISVRTNEVLFAKVRRDEFHAVAIFDHSVFESIDENGSLSVERQRMWDIHKKYTTLGMRPGTAYIASPITSSGHPINIRRMADVYMSRIDQIDANLSARTFVNEIYQSVNMQPPTRYNFEWQIEGLDLAIFDTKNNVRFIVYEGYL